MTEKSFRDTLTTVAMGLLEAHDREVARLKAERDSLEAKMIQLALVHSKRPATPNHQTGDFAVPRPNCGGPSAAEAAETNPPASEYPLYEDHEPAADGHAKAVHAKTLGGGLFDVDLGEGAVAKTSRTGQGFDVRVPQQKGTDSEEAFNEEAGEVPCETHMSPSILKKTYINGEAASREETRPPEDCERPQAARQEAAEHSLRLESSASTCPGVEAVEGNANEDIENAPLRVLPSKMKGHPVWNGGVCGPPFENRLSVSNGESWERTFGITGNPPGLHPVPSGSATTQSNQQQNLAVDEVKSSQLKDPKPNLVDMFGDRSGDKKSLDEEEYDVSQYYHEVGFAQMIARSDNFAHLTLLVITMNAIYIGVDADRNTAKNLADAHPGFQVCEIAFFAFFAVEWFARFLAFRDKRDCLRDMWFMFDSALCFLMFLETWILGYVLKDAGVSLPTGLIKMLRLLRLARMARLMRSFPELVAMFKGVKVASRAVGSALLMLVLLVYIFAIIMHMLTIDENSISVEPVLKERFDGLFAVMMTLLIDGTFMDNIGLLSRNLTNIKHPLVRVTSVAILWVFVLCSALTVMNMLIGVLCEVVSAVAAAEKEDAAIKLVKNTLLVMLKKLDEDASGEISQDEISLVFYDAGALEVLQSLQVDVSHLVEVLDMYYEETSALAINLIMEVILMLRGDRQPMVKDMVHWQKYSRWRLEKTLIMSQFPSARSSTVELERSAKKTTQSRIGAARSSVTAALANREA